MIIRLAVAGSALLCAIVSGFELSHRSNETLFAAVDPLQSTRELAVQERWAEVKMLTDYFSSQGEFGSEREIIALSNRADVELNSFNGQFRRFAQGALSGEPTDIYSLLGSLALDLFVVGDIRDLAVQGWKEVSGGNGDTIILGLSAVGLATTLTPHVDWAAALLKTMKRGGALTGSMVRSLSEVSRQAINTGNFARLSKVTTDLGRLARSLGPGPAQGVMRNIDSVDELAKVANAAEINPTHTYVVTRLLGKNGVKQIQADGKNIGLLGKSIKTGSRFTKIVKKATSFIPTLWLMILFAVSALVLIKSIGLPGNRKRSRTGVYRNHRAPLHSPPAPPYVKALE